MISTGMILGFGVAILVGGVLGVLGAGGAILAVPALVYLFEVPIREATHLSLGVVALVALLGIVQSWKSREVDLLWTARFFVPSSIGVILARNWLISWIPQGLEFVLMLAFAGLMVLAARAMLRKSAPESAPVLSLVQFGLRSFAVGGVTGLLGAGGGFLIVPILTLWAGLSFRIAAATSLAVIFLNSALGFASGWSSDASTRLPLLLQFVMFSALGLIASRRFAREWSPERLRQGFGYFLLVIGLATLVQEAVARL